MRVSVAVALCLSLASLSVADPAVAAVRKHTNIAPQPLDAALHTLANEHQMQMLYRSEVVGSLNSPGAAGDLTIDEALTRILSGSGLTFRYIDDKTITVIPVPAGPRASAKSAGNTSSPGDVMRIASAGGTTNPASANVWERYLAQADQGVPVRGAQVGASDSAVNTEKYKLEEIIVTAQKREERLQDVPMSVVAVSGDDLQRRGISNTGEIALAIPGVAAQDRGAGNFRYVFIRGVGNTRGSQTLVGTYLDEQDVTSFPYLALDLRAYDLERLEVLRGPQGTLYGSGAMGGVIRYITRKPSLSDVSGDAYITASTTESGATSQTVGGSLSVPLVSDVLGIRIAGLYEDEGGWIDQPALSKKDINDQRLRSLRLQGLWRPVDSLELSATATLHKNDTGAPNIAEDDQGNYTQLFGRATTPSGHDDYEIYNLTARYTSSNFQVVSSTGYFDQAFWFRESGAIIPVIDPAFHYLVLRNDTSVQSFVQEVRVSSMGSGRFTWTGGASYRDAKHSQSGAFLFGQPGAATTPIPLGGSESTKAWAVFGEGGFALTDRLTVGMGLRYYQDRQEIDDGYQAGTFEQLSPRFLARFALTSDVNIYANVAKGFRSGGFNEASATALGAPPDYESDKIWSYELGSKGTLFAGRLSFDVAAFYSDYVDAQDVGEVLINGVPVDVAGNLGDAVIKGVDWDLALQVTDGLSIGTGGEWLDGKYTEIHAVSASQAVGDPLKQIPDYHFNAWAMQTIRWPGSDSTGYVRVEFNKQGKSEYRNRTYGPNYFSRSDVVNLLDASVGWQKGPFGIDVVARNLLNDRGYVDAESLEHLAARSRPRTYGVNLRYAF